MRSTGKRRERPPLDDESLNELALLYVARFATTRAKLAAYLARKVRERGWHSDAAPDLEQVAASFAERGYIDDAAFAISKSRSLTARGYGARRVEVSLRAAGVGEEEGRDARALARTEAAAAALRFAERRRIGPFAGAPVDPRQRERALAAMIRAGHGFDLARAVVEMPPGPPPDADELSERLGLSRN